MTQFRNSACAKTLDILTDMRLNYEHGYPTDLRMRNPDTRDLWPRAKSKTVKHRTNIMVQATYKSDPFAKGRAHHKY